MGIEGDYVVRTLDHDDAVLGDFLPISRFLQPRGVLAEIDNSTEPVNSERDRESIRRKIHFHERLQDFLVQAAKSGRGQPRRYRLVFFTKGVERAYHILSLAKNLAANPDRRLCYAVAVDEFLAEPDALRSPCFLDHHGRWQPLINTHPTSTFNRAPVRLLPLVAQPTLI